MNKERLRYLMKLKVRTLVLFFLCVTIYTGNAQDLNDDSFFELSLEELMNIDITTASKTSQKINEAPGTIVTISKQDIIDRGYANLKDIFHDLPGMNAFEYSYAEQGTVVPIRGIVGNQKFIILLNGVRVNPAGGEEFKLNSDFSIRGARQIEVIYGPGSTLYGQDGISAIINVITEQADDKVQFNAQLVGGMNSHREIYANYSTPFKIDGVKEGSITAMVQYTNTDLDDRSNTNPEWNDQINNIGGNAQQIRFDEGFSAFLNVESGQSSIQVFHRESRRSSSDGGFTNVLYFQPEAVWHDRSTTVEARNLLEFSDNVNLESSISFNRYEIDPDSRYVFPGGPNSFFLDDYKYGVGTRTALEEKLSWVVSDKVSFIAGLSLVNSDILPKATIPGQADPSSDLTAQGGTWDYVTSTGDSISVQRVNNILFQQFGAYSEIQLKPIDKLRVSIGLRGDASTLFDDKPFSPRISAVYNLTDKIIAKYMYSQAFVIPAPYFGYATAFDGSNLVTLNENIEPEKAKSHELNLTYSASNTSVTFSGYYNTLDNLILLGESATSANVLDDNTIYNGQNIRLTQTVNQGSTETYGFDIFSRVKMGNASFWGSYSFVDGDITILGEATSLIENKVISNHNVRLGATYHFSSKLITTLSGKISSTPEGIRNYANLYGLDSELNTPYQINLHANYLVNDNFRAFVNVRNITNHSYAMRGVRDPVLAEAVKVIGGIAVNL